MKSWEYSMTSAMRVAMRQGKFDLLNLYLKLERASKQYLENGEMKEGDAFKVPLEDGAFLRQSFYKEYSTLTLVNPNKTEMVAISKKDSIQKEYRFLLGYSQALKNSGLGIGAKYNKEFEDALRDVKVGQVLVFDNGKSFVCDYNRDNVLRLVRTSDATKIPHLSEFKNSEYETVVFDSSISIQHFYAKVRDNFNDDVRMRITTTTKAQETLNRLVAGLDENKVKTLVLGPNKITVKRAFASKRLSYYDEQGYQISEEQVKRLLGWLDASPVVTEFVRSSKTSKSEFLDNVVREEVDTLLEGKDYISACNIIEGYCIENEQNLSVNISSYLNQNGRYEAVSFVFVCKNGKSQIYKATYEDNDFTKEPTSLVKSNSKEFESFCKEKYGIDYVRIQNQIKNELLKNYPRCKQELMDKIAKRIASMEMESKFTRDVSIGKVRDDIDTMANEAEEDFDRE